MSRKDADAVVVDNNTSGGGGGKSSPSLLENFNLNVELLPVQHFVMLSSQVSSSLLPSFVVYHD